MNKKHILYIILILALAVFITRSVMKENNRQLVYELVEAIKVGDEVVIEKCMSKSLDMNIVYKRGAEAYPETPLTIACDYGRFDLVKRMVLEKNADVNYVPKGSGAPVSRVFTLYGEKRHTLDEYIEIYDFLREQGADITIDPPLKRFGFSVSIEKYIRALGEEDTIKLIDYLFESGAEYGNSRIITGAARINNLNILRYLIEKRKVEINYGDIYDSIALLLAVKESSYECAEYLVDLGFRQDITFGTGKYQNMTAIEVAMKKNDQRMVEILKKGKDEK